MWITKASQPGLHDEEVSGPGVLMPLAHKEAPGQERDGEGEVHRDVVGVGRLEQLRRTCGCLDGGLDPGLGG
jgi:hypothetical protein